MLLLRPSVVLVKQRKHQQQLRVLEVLARLPRQQQLRDLEDLVRLPRQQLHRALEVLDKQHRLQQLLVLEVLVKHLRRLLLLHSVALDSLKLQLQLRPSGGSDQASELQQRQRLWPPHWEASEPQPPLLQLLYHSEPPIPGCLVDWGAPLPSASLSLSNHSSSLGRAGMQLCTSQ